MVFEPAGAPKAGSIAHVRTEPRTTRGSASLPVLTRRCPEAGPKPLVTLLELHKLTCFAQATGGPLRPRFTEGSYGPCAENLGHVLNRIEGRFMSGYAGGGDDAPDKAIELIPGAPDRAINSLKKNEKMCTRRRRRRPRRAGP